MGASALADAAHKNDTLLRLNLWGNSLGAHGAAVLALGIGGGGARSLTELDLRANGLGADGAVSIADLLKEERPDGRGLRTLSLAMNDLGAEGIGCIADALRVNESLTSIDLSANGVGNALGPLATTLKVSQRRHVPACRPALLYLVADALTPFALLRRYRL